MKKILYAVFIVAIVMALAVSCTTPGRTLTTLNVKVQEGMGPKLLLPDGDWTFHHYAVTIQRGTDAPMTQTVGSPPPIEGISFPNIPVGTYNITVQGFNIGSELLGTGSDTALIEVNQTTTTIIQVDWLSGTGTASMDITLSPPDLIYNPLIEGELYDGTDWSPVTITQGPTGHWTLNETLEQGYYAIAWRLFSDGDIKVLVSGLCEAVFILKDRTSAGTYLLDSSNVAMPPQVGGSIVILWEAPQPIIIGFVGAPDSVNTGETFTLTTASSEPLDSFTWYKNGVLLDGEVGYSLTVIEADTGYNHYSVLGRKGDILTSATKGVAVLKAIASYVWTQPTAPVFINYQVEMYTYRVQVLDGAGDPLPDGTTVFWKVSDKTNSDYTASMSPTSSTTTGGIAQSQLIWDGNNGDCTFTVKVGSQPGATGVTSTNAFLTSGNY